MNDLISQAHICHRRVSRRAKPSWAVAALAVASLFALVISGCGSKNQTSPTTSGATTSASGTAAATTTPTGTPDAAQLVAESSKTTQTLRTVHIALNATNLPNLPVETVNADVSSEQQGNGQALGDAKFRANPNAEFVDTQFLVTDKTFYTKTPEGTWKSVGPAEKIYDPGIILDKDKGLAYVIKSVQNPKVDGKETINGVNTVKVSGTIDASVIDPVVPTLGKGGGTLPITLYIADVAPPSGSPTTSVPSEAPSSGAGPNLVRFVVNKDQGNVNVTLSNWAKPVNIPKPTG